MTGFLQVYNAVADILEAGDEEYGRHYLLPFS